MLRLFSEALRDAVELSALGAFVSMIALVAHAWGA